MKKIHLLFLSLFYTTTACYAQLDASNPTTGGPIGDGSWLRFTSGGNATSIQENWGMNLSGAPLQPVKVINTSFLVGYTTVNQDFGQGNALISGNVGIGTTNLTAKFNVHQSSELGNTPKNNILLSRISGLSGSGAGANVYQNSLWLVRNSSGNDWYSTRWHDGISIDLAFINPQTDTRTWWERDPSSGNQSWGDGSTTFLIINQGNVGVGTKNPDAKLAVNGTIHSREVKVDLTGWPDYVFEPKYYLPTLGKVKTYVDQNHHLQDMPSALQIEKEGLNLGEMNAKLLKKVEELTLYLIAENKKNEDQQKQIDKLRKQLKARHK